MTLNCQKNMSEQDTVVKEELTTPEVSETTQSTEDNTDVAPGSKTDSALLLKSLQEEREKVKRIEEEKARLEEELLLSKSSDDEVFSEEGKALKTQISSLESKIAQITQNEELNAVFAQYPILKENADRFKEYRQAEHPKAKILSVAKLFMAENDLLTPERKGLEDTTGGPRNQVATQMTVEDIKRLRETNYKLYTEKLMSGEIPNLK